MEKQAKIEIFGFKQKLSFDSMQALPESEQDSQQEPLKQVQLLHPPKPQCSVLKSIDTPVFSGAFVSPSQFRQPLKSMPRANKRKRKPGRSIIATDTSEIENIRLQRSEVKKRKLPKKNKKKEPKNKAVRKLLQSDSEDNTENISVDVEDSDWCEEKEAEDEIEIPTDEKLLLNVLPRLPEESDYILVRFSTKRKSVYFVGKVLDERTDNFEYYVSFLRANQKYQFHMPSNPDLSC